MYQGSSIAFGLAKFPVSEFELVAEELLMSDSVIKVHHLQVYANSPFVNHACKQKEESSKTKIEDERVAQAFHTEVIIQILMFFCKIMSWKSS